jgi:anti-sigma B factor antagonist
MCDAQEFTIDYERVDGHVVVSVSGELDGATAPRLLDGLTASASDGVQRVILDVAQVGFIDSTGLRALLQSRAHVLASGRVFDVRNPTAAAVRLFELTGTHRLLLGDRINGSGSGSD